jgi:hypothetical protein
MSDHDQDPCNIYKTYQDNYYEKFDQAQTYWTDPSKYWEAETETQLSRIDEVYQNNITNSSSSSSGSGGGSCFVATACFEGASHPTVSFLRDYRDTILVKSKVGRAFIACYNEIGPHLAKAVNKLPETKPALRSALTHFSKKIADHYKGQLSPLTPAATRPQTVRDEKDPSPTPEI